MSKTNRKDERVAFTCLALLLAASAWHVVAAEARDDERARHN